MFDGSQVRFLHVVEDILVLRIQIRPHRIIRRVQFQQNPGREVKGTLNTMYLSSLNGLLLLVYSPRGLLQFSKELILHFAHDFFYCPPNLVQDLLLLGFSTGALDISGSDWQDLPRPGF